MQSVVGIAWNNQIVNLISFGSDLKKSWATEFGLQCRFIETEAIS